MTLGSHVEFGCELNTSNYITSTVVNYHRCNGTGCLPQINNCWCDEDVVDISDVYTGSPDFFPWYNPNEPASGEYLGKMIFKFDGLDSSPYERTISSGIAGPYAQKCLRKEREILVSGVMFATSSRGMDFGKRWEREQLWKTFCGCADSENTVKVRMHCDAPLVELRGFTPKSGPSFETFYPNNKCSDFVQRFSYTAALLDPFLYGESVELGYDVFDEDTLACERWETETVAHTCGPECCRSCTKVSQLSFLYDYGVDSCCYCRPLATLKKAWKVDVPGSGELGFDLKVFSGESTFANGRFMLIDAADDPSCLDDFAYDKSNVLGAVEFAPIPAEQMITVNGRSNCVKASCGEGEIWVYDAGGLPFSGLSVSPDSVRHTLWAVFEADYYNSADDAQVGVSVFRKF